MPLDVSTSQKGKVILTDLGYSYIRERQGLPGFKDIWRCTNYTTLSKCRGRCHTLNNEIIYRNDAHNHEGDVALLLAKHTMHEIKSRAETSIETPARIMSTIIPNQHISIQGKLPPKESIKRAIRNKRNLVQAPLPEPQSLRDFVIEGQYSLYKNEQFVLFDSGPAEDRIIIFGTQKNLDILTTSSHLFADGTFKPTPKPFFQLYSIHVIQLQRVLPLLFVLLPNKQEATYTRMLVAIKNLCPLMAPQSVLIDFEKAAENAFSETFPGLTVRGCFFHLCQALYRHVLGDIRTQYLDRNNPDFALWIRHLPSLAFVPENQVIDSFIQLIETPFYRDNEDMLAPLVDYFENTYIGRLVRAGRRRAPKFKISMWNCHERTSTGLARTNNAIEGWHQSFQSLLTCYHPSIWKFIDALKLEQGKNDAEMEQGVAGVPPTASRKVYKNRAERVARIVADYGNRNLLDYLRGLAHNFNLQH